MPISSSGPHVALCILAAALSAACGDDPTPGPVGVPVSDAALPSGASAADSGATQGDTGAASKPDAGAAGLDATVPGATEAGAQVADATIPPVDGGTDAGPTDAGAVAVDSATPVADAKVVDAQATDAQTPDASSSVDTGTPQPSDAGQPLCIERGDNCDKGSCCEGSACVHDESGDSAHCVTPCQFPTPCDKSCGNYCGAEGGSVNLHCREPILLAKDGSYLGRASSSTIAPEGVCNVNSLFGNGFGTYSIHNKNGNYGNTFSPESPYAPSNFDGPAIACPDEQVRIAYVNKAGSGFDDIDPDELCSWLSMRGF
ncbi:MAG: hypothetical protein RLZZ450_258 [Pseudomonadota bacterium]|jgi:hypothetical protein